MGTEEMGTPISRSQVKVKSHHALQFQLQDLLFHST